MMRFTLSFALTVLLVIGGIWYWVLTQPMRYFDMNYALFKVKLDLVEQCRPQKLIILGDSKTLNSVMPERIGPQVLNLAVGSNNILDGLLQTRHFLHACKDAPQAVVLSYGFINFIYTDVFYSIRYGYPDLTLADLERLRAQSRAAESSIYGKPTPLDFDARVKNLQYWVKWPSLYFSSLLNSRFMGRAEENRHYYDRILASRGFFALPNAHRVRPEVNVWTEQKEFVPQPLQVAFMDELLDLYAARNVPVYYLSPAYSTLDVTLLAPQVKTQFRNYLTRMERRHANFHVIGEAFATLPNENFGDDIHLNPAGAELWTKIFRGKLEGAGIPH